MRCVYCSANASPDSSSFIEYDKVVVLLRDAISIGCERLTLTGGEPLLHRDLPNMIREAKKLGIREARVFSSSLVICDGNPRSVSDELINELVEAGLDAIVFNLQGGRTTHEKASKTPGSFDSVISSARRFKERGVFVGFHYVPMKENFTELELIVSLANSIGVDEVGVLMFVPQGRGLVNRSEIELDKEEFEEFLRNISSLKSRYETPKLRFGCPFNGLRAFTGSQPKVCSAAGPMVHILINGQAAPCSAFKWDRELQGGNVYEESLNMIMLNGFGRFRELREELGAKRRCTAQLVRNSSRKQ